MISDNGKSNSQFADQISSSSSFIHKYHFPTNGCLEFEGLFENNLWIELANDKRCNWDHRNIHTHTQRTMSLWLCKHTC